MIESIQIRSINGKKLTTKELRIINKARFQDFGSTSLIKPAPSNDDWEKLYFLANDHQERLLAFGRLHNVNVTFQNQVYDVLGIATIIAVVKGQGVGSLLLSNIKSYIESTGLTGLGFCKKSLSDFYRARGFGIIEDSDKRFIHPEPLRFPGSNALYVPGKHHLMHRMFQYPNEQALLSRPQW